MRIDFRAPARLDDALDVSVALRQCRHASLVIAQDIRCDGRLLLDAEVKVAALDADGFRPRGIPETLYEELKSLEQGAQRSEERRVGKECVSKGRSRWSPSH